MVLDLCDETHDVMIVMMVVDGGGGSTAMALIALTAWPLNVLKI